MARDDAGRRGRNSFCNAVDDLQSSSRDGLSQEVGAPVTYDAWRTNERGRQHADENEAGKTSTPPQIRPPGRICLTLTF